MLLWGSFPKNTSDRIFLQRATLQLAVYSYDGHFNKSKVLSWNSRWCSPIGLTQSDIMTSLSHGTADWFFCIISQWACCSVFKNLTSVCCSSCSMLQKPSTIPSSTCIDLLDVSYMWGLFHVISAASVAVARLCSSRSVLPRPNTWTFSFTLLCQTLQELSW